MVIDKKTLDNLNQAMELRNSPEEGSQRMLNALVPETVMPIHHHKVDEMFVILRGLMNVTIHDDRGKVIQSVRVVQ